MTQEQAAELGAVAKALMPKSNDAQVALLEKAIERVPFEIAEEAITAHAMSSEFIGVPRIRELMNQVMAAKQASERMREARAAKAAAQRASDESIRAARDFCRQHTAHVPEMLAAVLAEDPKLADFVAKHPVKDRDTLQSLVLCSKIFERFKHFAPPTAAPAPVEEGEAEEAQEMAGVQPGVKHDEGLVLIRVAKK